MYEAFELQRLVERLPLKICALATWGECIQQWGELWRGLFLINAHLLILPSGDNFMISTISSKNEAHLLMYQIRRNTYHEYEAKLNKTLKKFTYKPITQVRGCGGWA